MTSAAKHKKPTQTQYEHRPRWLIVVLCALLLVITASVYWQVRDFGFLNYDDKVYVSENPNVLNGLTFRSVLWSFSWTYQAANWHPFTWLSLIVDNELSGIDPGAFHLSNLLLHLLATLLLLVVMTRMTRRFWASFVVAALFALHPLHVESVAWIAERKDVLSGLFWMLTMLAYTSYAKNPSRLRYMLVLVMFVCGLLSKPMLVSLPFVLLLMDYWPLGRFGGQSVGFKRLVVEKIPLFVLSFGSAIVTFIAQRQGGATQDVVAYPVGVRVANAAVSYVVYLIKTFVPTKLACFYPHPQSGLPLWQVIGSILFIAAITYLVIRSAKSRPYLIVGWLWYLITLIPVIGLVQVGWQALADRYTYIPLIGIFVIIAWSVPDLLAALGSRWRQIDAMRQPLLNVVVTVVLATLTVLTYQQVGYWRSDITLFGHAVNVTSNNCDAQYNLGAALLRAGQNDAGLRHLRKALRINPDFYPAQYNLACALMRSGDLIGAVPYLRKAVKLAPNEAKIQLDLGACLAQLGMFDEAIPHLKKAISLDPLNHMAQNNLGRIYLGRGKIALAIKHYTAAVTIKPDNADYAAGLEQALSLR